MPDDSELDRIDPQPRVHKLSTGFEMEVVRLRTRQFFRLLRILTHGAGPALTQTQLNFEGEAAEFAGKLLTLVLMSIPDAEAEAIAFLASMCRPHGIIDKAESQLGRTPDHLCRTTREARRVWIPQDGHLGGSGYRLLEHLQPLSCEAFFEGEGEPRHVPAGMRQAGDEPEPDGIADAPEHHGNRAGGALGRQGTVGRGLHDHIDT